MAVNFDDINVKIIQKSQKMENIHGCLLWQGSVGNNGYGRKKLKTADGKWKIISVHRIVYMCKIHSYDIPTMSDDGTKLEISHICNHKLCINVDHLALETHDVNMERGHCFLQNQCTKAHQPYCLIWCNNLGLFSYFLLFSIFILNLLQKNGLICYYFIYTQGQLKVKSCRVWQKIHHFWQKIHHFCSHEWSYLNKPNRAILWNSPWYFNCKPTIKMVFH